MRRKGAFTLIELIMTIVVVGIVAVPLSLLVSQHISSLFVSEDLTMAYQLARAEMERVLNLPFANITTAAFSGYEGYNYDVARIVVYAQGSNASPEGLKKVTTQVTKANGTDVLADVVMYTAKNVGYGV